MADGTSRKQVVGLIASVVAMSLILLMPTPAGLGVPGQRMIENTFPLAG